MSDYRVFDLHKNIYDADVLSDIVDIPVEEPTPNGFKYTNTYTQTTNPYTGNATITITSEYGNPMGETFSNLALYIMNYSYQQVSSADDVDYNYQINIVNNTKFDIVIAGMQITEGGQNGMTSTLDTKTIKGYSGEFWSGSGQGTGGILGGWDLRIIKFTLNRA